MDAALPVEIAGRTADEAVDDASHVVARYARAGFTLADYSWSTHAAAGPSALTLSFVAARADAVAPPAWTPVHRERNHPARAAMVVNTVLLLALVVLLVIVSWVRLHA